LAGLPQLIRSTSFTVGLHPSIRAFQKSPSLVVVVVLLFIAKRIGLELLVGLADLAIDWKPDAKVVIMIRTASDRIIHSKLARNGFSLSTNLF
jgi:hypothetical protein